MDYSKIVSLQRENGLTNKRMAEIIGIGGQGYVDLLNRKSAKVEYLENLCNFFNVPISYFFEKDLLNNESNEVLEPKAPYLTSCKSCTEKDSLISFLQERMKFYEGVINNYLSSIMKATGT